MGNLRHPGPVGLRQRFLCWRLRRLAMHGNLAGVLALLDRQPWPLDHPIVPGPRDGYISRDHHSGHTLLHWAAREGHVEMVMRLVERGATPTRHTDWGITAMHLAASVPSLALVAYLATQGLDPKHGIPSLSSYAEDFDASGPNSLEILRKHGHTYRGDEHLVFMADQGYQMLDSLLPTPSSRSSSARARL